MNKHIFIPSKGPNSWKDGLADPEKQWATGYSARTLAHCWEDENEFPGDFKKVLNESGLDLKLLLAIPEYKVYLDTYRAPSQNDLFVLSRFQGELVVMMIEGKVSESFDKLIKDWKNSEGKSDRLKFLKRKLEIDKKTEEIEDCRYQLFHRTASAILTAEKFTAKKAIMIVHSFSQSNEWFDDYKKFVKLINPNVNPRVNEVIKCKTLASGIELYVGWIKGGEKYLIM